MFTIVAPYRTSNGSPASTKKTFRTEANAKQRNRARIISALRSASKAGRTTDVTIITCCANLTNELSGLKAHRMLAPASARHAKRQRMCGGQISLPKREGFRKTKMAEIIAKAGQKILAPQSGSNIAPAGECVNWKCANNGDTIKA